MDLKNKKGHKKVIIHTRKLSSTNNRSQRSFLNSTATAKYKQRISTLSKNNKLLAISLEDVRCELSTKQKLLDDLYEHLNNIMFARFRMLEMQSGLKSFIKSFDEILLFLKVDGSKCPDVGVPSQSNKYWKNPMEKIVESFETHSDSVQDEMVDIVHKTARNSSNQISNTPIVSAEEIHDGIEKNCLNMNVNASGTQVIPMNAPDNVNQNFALNEERIDDENTIIESYNQQLSNSIENPTSSQDSNEVQATTSRLTSVLPSKDCEGMMSLKTTANESPVNSEDSGTPKLSILPKTVDAETFSGMKVNSCNKRSSSNKNKSKVLKNSSGVKPPVIIQCSKIPKMQPPLFKKKMKRNLSGIISKKKLTKAEFAIGAKESNLNSHQSKELITEDQRQSEHEPVVVLDKISNPEMFSEENIGESGKTAHCRKTFVIKPSASENTQNSPSNRRKTFVKKPNDMSKAVESIKNRRETFTLPEHSSTLSKLSKECVKQDKSSNLVECIQSDINLCSNKKDEPVTVQSSIDYQSNIGIFDNVNKDYSCNLQKNNADYVAVKEIENTSENEKSEKFGKTTCEANNIQTHSIEDSETLIYISSDLPNNLENILGDKNTEVCCNKPLTESPKLLLESPLSECESISQLDLPPIENVLPIEQTPIRRQISKTNKVFFFDINEKCIPNKALGDCVQESSDFVQQSTAFCQPNVGNASNEVKEYQDVENHKEKNKKKSSACGHSKDNIIDNISSDSVDKKKAVVKIRKSKEKVKNKIKKKYKNADTGIKGCITFPAVSNCFEDKEPNEIQECIRKDHGSSVPILNKNETLNEGERMNGSSKNENNMNLKCRNDDGKLDASFGEVKNRGRCRKTNTYTKQLESMDDDTDDIISAPKKSKRTNSKKKLIENIKQNVTNNNAIDDIISVPKRNKGNNSGKKTSKNTCLDEKMQKCPKKAKRKVKTSTMLSNTPEKNTFLVHADVHPVPPSYMPETDILNKENEEIRELQVSVVLNDFMKSENNTLNVYRKDTVLHESKNLPLKTVLSDNSSNIPLPVDDIQKDYRNSNDTTSNSEEVSEVYSMDRRRRRRSNINYREMSLSKKLRR